MSVVADLFGASGAGAWFDSSAKHLMWKDASRTEPVTADGDLVALQWSRGIGSNLWDNPTPSIGDGGTGSNGVYTAETMTFTNTSTGNSPNYPRFQFDLGLTSTRYYEVTGKVSGDLGAVTRIRLTNSGFDNNLNFDATTGVFTTVMEAGSQHIQFDLDGQQLFTLTIDELDIREIPPTIYRQQTTEADRPIYREASNEQQAYLDYAGGKEMDFVGTTAGFKFLHDGTGGSLITVLEWGRNQDADRYAESFALTTDVGIRINKAVTEPTQQLLVARGVSSSVTTGTIKSVLTGDVEMCTFTYEYDAPDGQMIAYKGSGVRIAGQVDNTLAPDTGNASGELVVVSSFEGHEYHFIAIDSVLTSTQVGSVYESLKHTWMKPVPRVADFGMLLLGQSNMEGAANFADKVAEAPLEGVYMYDKMNEFRLATEPTHYDLNSPDGWKSTTDTNPKSGWALRTAKSLMTNHGKTTMLIPTAVGSTSIAQWDTPTQADDTSTLFGAAMTRYRAARDRFTYPLVLIYGHEASRSLAFNGLDYVNGSIGIDYQDAFRTYLNHVTDFVGKETPIFMVQLAGENVLADAQANAAAGEAQRQLELEYPYLFLIPAYDVERNASTDDIHVSRDGQDVVADRVALAIREHVLGADVNGTGPRLTDIDLTDRNTVTITMDRQIQDSESNYGDLFIVYDNGVAQTITSAARNDDNTRQIVITVSEDMVGPVTLTYGYKAGPDNTALTDIVKDDDGMPLPVFGPINTRHRIPSPIRNRLFSFGGSDLGEA